MRKLLWLGAILFAVIVVPNAHADTFTDRNGTIIYPDGSTITSYTTFFFNQYEGDSDITFDFGAGTGFVGNESTMANGQAGRLDFTQSVTDVSIYMLYSGSLHMNFFSSEFGELGEFTEPTCTTATSIATLCTAVVNLANPGIFGMVWDTEDEPRGIGGINSMTYTAVPEPSAGFLLLTGVVLLGLVMVRKRNELPTT